MARRVVSSWLAILVCIWSIIAPTQAQRSSGAGIPGDVDAIAAIEHGVETAVQRGDSAFLESTLGKDFRFTHATGTVAGKSETLSNFAKPGNFVSRRLTAVGIEVHGNVAITHGRIEVRSTTPREYTICYTRLYERRGGRWQLLSHRTFRESTGYSETCAP